MSDAGENFPSTPILPTVGRIVHFVAFGTPNGEYPAGVHRAALITAVGPPGARFAVSLAVFNPTGMFFVADVMSDETQQGEGTWHWPER